MATQPNRNRTSRPRGSARLSALLGVVAVIACDRVGPPPATPTAVAAADASDGAPAAPRPADPPSVPDQTPGLLPQPAPHALSDADVKSALYTIGDFPPRPPQLRPGPDEDRQLVEVYCIGCHSTAYIAMQPPLSRAAWEAIVAKMRSAFGAVVPDPAAQRIATYLHAYYGLQPRPSPRPPRPHDAGAPSPDAR